MDGFKKSLKESIQLRLSLSLSLSILLVALVAGACSFIFAFEEAHELQDDILHQVVQLIDKKNLSSSFTNATHLQGNDVESLIIQNLQEQHGANVFSNQKGMLPLPQSLSDGLHTLNIQDKTFRVLVKTIANGERIAVAQESGLRNEIAYDSALRTVMPMLIVIPVLLWVVAHLVKTMFQPILTLAKQIDQRAEQDLQPIAEQDLPKEIHPFIMAINALFTRVQQSMQIQQRFVADSAHELRSPMTAISLQAERLAEMELSPLALQRLQTLRQGIDRGRNLLEQLLTLAKVQSNTELPKTWVSIQHIYLQVLENLMPLAEAKQLDIGIDSTLDVQVWGNELDLFTLIKNLVDNAIRYTPAQGRVDLAVMQIGQQIILQVQDNGVGIAVTERQRVLDPFYRILGSEQIGSGLGLSIVHAICRRLDAEIHFNFTDQQSQTGLNVQIILAAKGD